MAKAMKRSTLILIILTTGLWTMNSGRNDGPFLSLSITASTFLYHFGMRLFVGAVVNSVMHNHADYNAPWFCPRKWETKLYQMLRIKCWKQKMPTYNPELFDGKKHTMSEIAQAMCQAEIVHEIIVLLSFLPLLAVNYVGAFPVFLITSLLSALFDLSFVMIQRYNRPRIVRILEKQKNARQHVLLSKDISRLT